MHSATQWEGRAYSFRMIHATPASSNILVSATLFFLFFPNPRNTRGVTKGVFVGTHQQSHFVKYEYPPDDVTNVLPGGRHTWSIVRRRRTSSHLGDVGVTQLASTEVIWQRDDGSTLCDDLRALKGLSTALLTDEGGYTQQSATCFEGLPPAMVTSAVRWG